MRRTDTRDRLVTTAAQLFHRQGYARTGVNEIIGGAEATSGSFYHFFDTKEALLMAVVDHVGAVMSERVFDAAGGNDPVGRVVAAARAYLEDHGPGLGSPVGTLGAELAASQPRVRERIAELYDGWSRQLEAALEDAGSRRVAARDRLRLARAVVGILEGAMLQARVHGDLAAFDATVAPLRDRPPGSSAARTEAKPVRRPPTGPGPPSRTRSDWRTW